MKNVTTVIMAGGMGERLKPLTQVRAKPAVPFGAIFRIIDFTLSNCINSGIRQVFVLTQYKSHSLSNHLKGGWGFLPRRLDQYVEEIPAQMQMGEQWYKGTADAIRQNMSLIRESDPSHVLILSGDHIYKMDYRVMKRFHDDARADATLSAVRVDWEEARGSLGVVEVDEEGRVVGFEEKPADPKRIPGSDQCLASMGIYIFSYGSLEQNLAGDLNDFGKDILPEMVRRGQRVFAFDFSTKNNISEYEYVTQEGERVKQLTERASDSDYWRDVGTLPAYWAANLDLVSPKPKFNLYGEKWPMFNYPLHFPPAKFVHESPGRTGVAINSVVSDGVIVSGAIVRNCILSPGVYVHSYSVVESSILMGGTLTAGNLKETVIGRYCKIRNAIIDKNVNISTGTVLGFNRHEDEARGLTVQEMRGTSDYIVAVPKNYVL